MIFSAIVLKMGKKTFLFLRKGLLYYFLFIVYFLLEDLKDLENRHVMQTCITLFYVFTLRYSHC